MSSYDKISDSRDRGSDYNEAEKSDMVAIITKSLYI